MPRWKSKASGGLYRRLGLGGEREGHSYRERRESDGERFGQRERKTDTETRRQRERERGGESEREREGERVKERGRWLI